MSETAPELSPQDVAELKRERRRLAAEKGWAVRRREWAKYLAGRSA
jgi:hypothetical protein